jgi:ABC-2 type transport system permease protein
MKMSEKKAKKSQFDIRKLLSSKQLKYGGYATVITAVVIAIAIILNVVVTMLEDNIGLRWDLTKHKVFSLSDTTIEILKDLKDDVKIYSLYPVGKENAMMKELLQRYRNQSDRISVQNVDPVRNPTFAQKFDKEKRGLPNGSLIITDKSEKKFKVLNEYDLYGFNYQAQTIDSLQAEQKITSAIVYVTAEENPVVYFLEDHQELSINTDLYFLKDTLENENFVVDTFSILRDDKELKKGDTLVIASPKRDLTEEERKKLADFLSKGGKAIFLMDPLKEDLPNFETLLKPYGIILDKSVVIEGNQSYFYNTPLLLVPRMESHDVTSGIMASKLSVVLPVARSIQVPEEEREGITVDPLFTSTELSWTKTDPESQSLQKEEGDKEGPFVLGVAITKEYGKTKEDDTRIVVIGTSQFISSSDIASLSGNLDLMMNSVNWVRNKKDSIIIRPKSLMPEQLNFQNRTQVLLLVGLVLLVVPLVVLGAGTVVWFRRRHL